MAGETGRRLTAAQRREQLLDAALTLAADGDVAALSVQDLAARAGVFEGLLYHYFPTKQALVVAAVRRAADALLADVRAAAADGPPEGRLTAGLAAYLDHVQAQPVGWRAALRARTGELAQITADLESASRELVLAALGVDEPSEALLVVLDGWSAFERGTCSSWLEHPTVSRAAVEELLLSSFVGALTTVARHDRQVADVLARLAAAGGD